MTALTYFEFDPSGQSETHYLKNENHTPAPAPVRLLIPKRTPFYDKDLVVDGFDENDVKTTLVRGTDYEVTEIAWDVYSKSGLMAYYAILIKNTVCVRFKVDYRHTGGDDCVDGAQLTQLYNQIVNRIDPVQWDEIKEKPYTFPSQPKVIDGKYVYNLGVITSLVYKLARAVRIGHTPIHDQLDRQADGSFLLTQAQLDAFMLDMSQNQLPGLLNLLHDANQALLGFDATQAQLQDNLEQSVMDVTDANLLNTTYNNFARHDIVAGVGGLLDDMLSVGEYDTILLPRYVPGLQLFLHTNLPGCLVETEQPQLRDLSDNGHVFTLASTSQIRPASRGLSGRVVHLKNQNAIKSAGPALNLTNESTIFLVYNASGFSVSHFDLLSGANGSVRIAESSGRAMSIVQGGQALWQTWNSAAAFSRSTTSKSIISTAASFYRSNSYGRSSWSNVESGASFNPQAIALNLTHLGAQVPAGELELQAILIYNRVLSVHEQFMIERFLAKMSGDKISYCSNSRFDFGKGAVIYGFQGANMAAYPAQKLIYATYNEVFSDNPTLSTQPSANTSKLTRIFVRGGSQATAFYKDLVVLVPGAYYSVHMNVMYGQTSPPHLALKIAGVQVDDVELSPSLGDVQDLVLRFRYLGHTPTTTFELFNLNESTSGNTFGVREITLVPDMFVNV